MEIYVLKGDPMLNDEMAFHSMMTHPRQSLGEP